MVQLAPSILSANFLRLEEELRALGGADWLHLDVMDGHFVPNISFGAGIVAQIASATELPLDVHLMIADPDRYVDDFIRAGAACISVHAEACRHLHRTLQSIRDRGVEASVALNPATPLEAVRWVLPLVQQVLVMTVNPGFGGQDFLFEVLPKVRELAAWRQKGGHRFRIQVDGGVNRDTCRFLVEAGADVLVVGSALFRTGDPAGELEALRRLVGTEV